MLEDLPPTILSRVHGFANEAFVYLVSHTVLQRMRLCSFRVRFSFPRFRYIEWIPRILHDHPFCTIEMAMLIECKEFSSEIMSSLGQWKSMYGDRLAVSARLSSKSLSISSAKNLLQSWPFVSLEVGSSDDAASIHELEAGSALQKLFPHQVAFANACSVTVSAGDLNRVCILLSEHSHLCLKVFYWDPENALELQSFVERWVPKRAQVEVFQGIRGSDALLFDSRLPVDVTKYVCLQDMRHTELFNLEAFEQKYRDAQHLRFLWRAALFSFADVLAAEKCLGMLLRCGKYEPARIYGSMDFIAGVAPAFWNTSAFCDIFRKLKGRIVMKGQIVWEPQNAQPILELCECLSEHSTALSSSISLVVSLEDIPDDLSFPVSAASDHRGLLLIRLSQLPIVTSIQLTYCPSESARAIERFQKSHVVQRLHPRKVSFLWNVSQVSQCVCPLLRLLSQYPLLNVVLQSNEFVVSDVDEATRYIPWSNFAFLSGATPVLVIPFSDLVRQFGLPETILKVGAFLAACRCSCLSLESLQFRTDCEEDGRAFRSIFEHV
eukprot:ANDGO_03043.mRNA.1 hypothetical protein